MRRYLPYGAVLLAYMMTPSAGEVVENVAHVLSEGHMAHAMDDEAHTPDSPEHGCSGPFHVCSCHSSTAFMVSVAIVNVSAAAPQETDAFRRSDEVRAEGHAASVFRPPIA